MTEQTRIFSKRTSKKEPRMGDEKNKESSIIAKMLNETYSADEFEEKLKKAIIALHKDENLHGEILSTSN